MSDEILSLAIFEPLPGNDEAAAATMQTLMAALAKHGYSRDLLYRDTKSQREYILFRYWKSEQARRAALEDPEVLRCWAELSQQIRTIKVYESLDEVLRDAK
ncbi:MAG TPA: antibiotic biosynthesis monooxygenase [Terriglobales bacterium]|nr:antibiotic biosynthesis monooxygenase [Terriglobales bacterium]HXY14322.1 antibiotic biosynthesis monooxygenase [Terriglobales bacterium]